VRVCGVKADSPACSRGKENKEMRGKEKRKKKSEKRNQKKFADVCLPVRM